MNILTDCIRLDAEYAQVLRTVIGAKERNRPLPLLVTGLCDGATDAAYAALIEDIKKQDKRTTLIICPEEKECVRVKNFLGQFGINTAFFVGRDLTFYNITASHEYEHERLRVLAGMLDNSFGAIVTTPDAALSYTMPPDMLIGSLTYVDFDKPFVDPARFAERLVELGYVRTEIVSGAGQFAIRGGIIDVFPSSARFYDIDDKVSTGSQPFRIELFGDEIDRMEIFDAETQRMITPLNRVEFAPARELLISTEKRALLRAAIESRIKSSKDSRAIDEMKSELSAIDRGADISFADKYITLVYPERTTLLSYFSKQSTVFIRGYTACLDRIKAAEWHLHQIIEELLEGGTINAKYTDYSKDKAYFEEFLASSVTVHFESLGQGLSDRKLGGLFNFRSKHMVSYSENLDLLCDDIASYRRAGYRMIINAENEAAAKNLCSLLEDRGLRALTYTEQGEFSPRDIPASIILVCWKEYIKGYELTTPRIVVMSACPDGREALSAAASKLKKRRKRRSGTEAIMSYKKVVGNNLEIALAAADALYVYLTPGYTQINLFA